MNHRILMVEDNAILALDIEQHLTQEGYEVQLLLEGSTFLKTTHDFCPDLILLDLQLPDCWGFDLLDQLSDSRWAATPVVIISAFTLKNYQEKASQMGVRAYLCKPLDVGLVEETIRQIVALSG
jgi:two-component system, response regulator PdtaR